MKVDKMRNLFCISSILLLATQCCFGQGFNVNPVVGIHAFNPGSVTRSVYDAANDIVYVTGTYDAATNPPDFDPDPFNVETLTAYGPAGTTDIYLATYHQDGTFLKVIGVGGDGNDFPLAIDYDASGNVYLGGSFNSSIIDLDPDVPTQSLANSGGFDGFMVVFDPLGNYLQSSGANTTGSDAVRGLKIDQFGDLVVTGNINGNMFCERYAGGDISQLPAFSFSIPGADGRELLLDSNDDIIVCGVYTGTVDFDPGLGVAFASTIALRDFYIAYYNAFDGSLIDLVTFGGQGDELVRRVAIGPSDEIYFTGQFDMAFDADPLGGTTLTPVGDYDVFVSKFNNDLTLAWAHSFGGSLYDNINGLVVNDFGDAFVAGLFQGNVDFDPGPSNYNILSTNEDAFLMKFNTDGTFGSVIGLGNSGYDEIEALVKIDNSVTLSFAGFATLNAELDPNCAIVTLDEYGYGWLGYQDVALLSAPVDQPTNLAFSNVTASTISAAFSPAASTPDGYLVLMSAGALPDIDPVDGVDYCLNDQLGTNGSGEVIYAIANGDINGFTTVGHSPGEQLFYKVFSYNGFGAATNYNTTSPLTGSQVTLTAAVAPAIQASGLQFSTITNNAADITWTRGDGESVIIVAKADNPVSEAPTLGQTYTASDAFGTPASQLGFDGNYVIYNGTGTDVTINNLVPGTTYHVAAYEYNGSSGTQSYLTTSATGNPSQFTTTNICAGDITGPDVFSLNSSLTVDQGADVNVSVSVSDSQGCPITEVKIYYVELENIADTDNPPYIEATMTEASAGTYTYTIAGASNGVGVLFDFEATNQAGLYGYPNRNYVVAVNVPDKGYTIPINSFGADQSNYRIVSLPLSGTNTSIEAVFDELGQYDRTKWRMYQYGSGNTSELTGSSTMAAGRGYWLIVREDPGPITVGAGTTVTAPFTLNLSQGWNLIGNPYNFDINWAGILAFNGDPVEVSPDLKVYKGSGAYTNGTELEKFSGGFVLASSPVSLDVPTYLDPAIQGRRVKPNHPSRQKNDIGQPDWELQLNVKSGGLMNTFGGLGMDRNALLGFDRYDELTLPRFLDYVEIVHDRPQVFNANYTRDMVPTAENFTWDFDIESNLEDPIVELTWDNSNFGNNNKGLYLWDEALSTAVNMRAQAGYLLNRNLSDRLKVVYGNPDYIKERIRVDELVFHNVSPNPATQKALISFTLPGNAMPQETEISAMDLMGRKIWKYNAQLDAGYHEVDWDIDHRTAKGIYLVQVRSGNVLKSKRIIIK